MEHSKAKSFKFISQYNSCNDKPKYMISPVFYFHSLEWLMKLKEKIHYFRFIARYGGHANDGNSLKIKIFTEKNFNKDNFENFLKNLKLNLYLYYENNTLSFSLSGEISGNSYDVDSDDISLAEKIENYINLNKIDVIDPPDDNWHFFCPKYYPDLF